MRKRPRMYTALDQSLTSSDTCFRSYYRPRPSALHSTTLSNLNFRTLASSSSTAPTTCVRPYVVNSLPYPRLDFHNDNAFHPHDIPCDDIILSFFFVSANVPHPSTLLASYTHTHLLDGALQHEGTPVDSTQPREPLRQAAQAVHGVDVRGLPIPLERPHVELNALDRLKRWPAKNSSGARNGLGMNHKASLLTGKNGSETESKSQAVPLQLIRGRLFANMTRATAHTAARPHIHTAPSPRSRSETTETDRNCSANHVNSYGCP